MSALQETAGLPEDHAERIARAKTSLCGLSVGDAFGERFFYDFTAPARYVDDTDIVVLIRERRIPPARWLFTDDTAMALSIYETLERHGRIDQDDLAQRFADRYRAEPWRGYGATAQDVLEAIGRGIPWQTAARTAFGGEGSMGNGGAMRVAPVGAYFAGDLAAVVENARASAEVTHSHPDGQAGAIAVAVVAAMAWRERDVSDPGRGRRLLQTAIDQTPHGMTRDGLIRAFTLLERDDPAEAASILGNGSSVVSYDTVPFCLWSAAKHLDSFEEAIWATVAGLGDRDTTCAIVGGIVSLAVGRQGIPAAWVAAREPLAMWELLGDDGP